MEPWIAFILDYHTDCKMMKLKYYNVLLCCREGEDIDAGTETNANLYHELYYHFVGTDQSKDILCWKDSENPKYLFGASVTDDGKVN